MKKYLNSKVYPITLVLLILFLMPAIANAGIIYVDASRNGDGSNWENAYKYLQDALSNANSGDEIWVAQGTYYPDEGAGKIDNDRYSTFQLKEGVRIYGGFVGGETSRDQRNWENNPTILSGDLDRSGSKTRNDAYSVVTGANNAVLDGFTITGGHANGDRRNDLRNDGSYYNKGGGMYNNSSSPTVTNCTFSRNSAERGGGMYNKYSSPTVTNCTFSSNSADFGGGGMCNDDSSSPTVTNCILWGDSGGEIYNSSGDAVPKVTYCNVQGGYTGTGNIDADPMFINPAAGDYHLSDYSPCIGAGTSEGAPAEDIEGNPRGTLPDMGAYENSRDVPLAVISPETTPLEVSGTVFKQDGVTLAPDGLFVTVTNTTRLLSITTETGIAGPGRYSATFISLSGIVAATGDKITVVVESDGKDIGSATHILTDSEVQAQKVTIDVSTHAAMDTYTIRAGAGSGGSIDPSGVLVVNKGTDKTFTITPDDGYYVADVLVDGASVGAVTSYTFTNVTADHTIEATFSISTPQITVSPSPIAFGNVLVGKATTVTVSIGNVGKADLNVTDITSDLGAILTISETTFTVVPDAAHEITLRFRYTFGVSIRSFRATQPKPQPGALTAATDIEIHGTLAITSNDPDSPTEIVISANVLPAKITQVSPTEGGLGTEITVEGANLGANEPVNIGFGTEETIAQVTTEADGSFSATFAITAPQPEGNVTIKAAGVTSGQEAADSSFVYLGPSIESLEVDKAEVRNGETFVISVVSESGLTVVADVSKVDNTKTTVTLTEEVDGTYTTSVTVSEENTAWDGVKTITVTATDAVGNFVTGTATIELISDIDAVKPLSTFKLNLAPGLNIISVPLANANASVNDRAPIEVKFVGDLKMLLGEYTSFYYDDTPAGKLTEIFDIFIKPDEIYSQERF